MPKLDRMTMTSHEIENLLIVKMGLDMNLRKACQLQEGEAIGIITDDSDDEISPAFMDWLEHKDPNTFELKWVISTLISVRELEPGILLKILMKGEDDGEQGDAGSIN